MDDITDIVISIEHNELVFKDSDNNTLDLTYSFCPYYEFDFDIMNSIWFSEKELSKLKNNFSFYNLLQDLSVQNSDQYTKLSVISVQGRKFAVDFCTLIGVKHTALRLEGNGINDCCYPLSSFQFKRFHSINKKYLFEFDKHVESFLCIKASSILWNTFTLQHLQEQLGFKIIRF